MRTLLLLSAALLAACGVVGPSEPVPEEHYYRLELPASQPVAAGFKGVVVVEALEAAAIHSRRPIVYSEDSQHLTLQEYHYHFWADPPPRLLQQTLVSYLRQAMFGATVADEAGRALWDYRVSGRVQRFERLRAGLDWQAAVDIELRVDASGERRPLLVKSYTRAVNAGGESMEQTVQAFARAVGEIYAEFLKDLQLVTPAPAPQP